MNDLGQDTIITGWVLTEKLNENGSEKIKARLVARGFEEEVEA